MIKSLKKVCSLFVIIALLFAMNIGIYSYADEVETVSPYGLEVIEDEVYSFREVLENVTTGLDYEAMDEVYFDGYQWNVTHAQSSTGGSWGVKDTWWARSTSISDRFSSICASNSDGEVINSLEMMIHQNIVDKNDKKIYWSLTPLWECASTTWINFVAPHTGKIVLFDELGNKIIACSEDEPFWAFQQDKTRTYKISVEKNDVKIWPENNDGALIDSKNRSVDFPFLGKKGFMPVTEGDVISIRIDVVGRFEGYSGLTAVTFNPCVAYIEIDKPVNDNEETFDDYYDYYEENDLEEDDSDWVLYLVIGATSLILIATIVIVVLLIKKKKSIASSNENTTN